MGFSAGGAGAEAAKGAGEGAAKGAADAGVAAEGAADVGAGAGLGAGALGAGEVGADAALGASAAGDVAGGTLASIGGDSLAGLGAGTVGDLGAGAGVLADAGAGAAGGADLSALGLTPEAGGGAATTGASSTLLPEQTVLGTAPAGAGSSSALGTLAQGVGPVATAGLAGAAAGGGGSGVPGTSGQPADFSGGSGPVSASNTPQFLSADDTGPSLGSLSPDMAQSLGVDPSSIAQPSMTSDFIDPSAGADNPGFGPLDVNGPSATDSIGSWFESPKNLGTAGLLGMSLKNALTQPKLPGASGTADAAATSAVQNATSIIQSGGTATPEWASQKASIDATINQQIQQQSEALQQAAASSGEGNQNSGIVQQQIAQMTANLNVQRQNLYAQAQQQNVQAALSELAGGDQTLASIGNMQLQQSEEARALSAQTAEMALLLQSGGSQKIPGIQVPGT